MTGITKIQTKRGIPRFLQGLADWFSSHKPPQKNTEDILVDNSFVRFMTHHDDCDHSAERRR